MRIAADGEGTFSSLPKLTNIASNLANIAGNLANIASNLANIVGNLTDVASTLAETANHYFFSRFLGILEKM